MDWGTCPEFGACFTGEVVGVDSGTLASLCVFKDLFSARKPMIGSQNCGPRSGQARRIRGEVRSLRTRVIAF